MAPFWKCRHFSPLPGAFRAICLRVCTGPSVSVCAQISHPIGPIPPQGRIEANQLHSRWVNIWSRLDRRRRINRGKSYSSISLPPPASKSMESTFNAIFNAPRHRPLMEHFAGLRVVDLGHCLFKFGFVFKNGALWMAFSAICLAGLSFLSGYYKSVLKRSDLNYSIKLLQWWKDDFHSENLKSCTRTVWTRRCNTAHYELKWNANEAIFMTNFYVGEKRN